MLYIVTLELKTESEGFGKYCIRLLLLIDTELVLNVPIKNVVSLNWKSCEFESTALVRVIWVLVNLTLENLNKLFKAA